MSDVDRKIICEFIAEKLKPGGLLYISYNTLPAWSPFLPVQRLMRSFSESQRSITVDKLTNLTESFRFVEKLMKTNPKYLLANKVIEGKIKALSGRQENYLIHEYLASDFTPMTFDELYGWLKPLGMDYVCSASVLNDNATLNLTQKQQIFLSKIKDVALHQTCKDLMVNKDFRSDYWVKGVQPLSRSGRELELDHFQLLLTKHSEDIKLEFQGALGKG